ncbi:MAG: hypothetical protein JXR96_18470 [Deltaproteobacteria bacterium]|nr:hypothetical protein [Deltaproteobacteria bacterium]
MNCCTRHPDSRAAWRCQRCKSLLCSRCAAPDGARVRCVGCGSFAEPLMIRKPIPPFWSMLPTFVRWIFRRRGLIEWLATGAVLGLAAWLVRFAGVGTVAAVLYLLLFVASFMLIVRRAAEGREEMPDEVDLHEYDELGLVLYRFLLATAILWIPTLLGLLYGEAEAGLLGNPVLLLAIGASVLYAPAAVVAAIAGRSLGDVLNPVQVLSTVTRFGRDYGVALLVLLVMGGLIAAVRFGPPGAALAGLPVPWVAEFVIETISLLPAWLVALSLGRLIFQNGEELGLFSSKSLLVPELPGARPTGVLERPEPELPGEAEDDELREAVRAGDAQAAAAAWAGRAPEDLSLSSELALRLAALLSGAGEHLQAAGICRQVAERDPQDPLAPRALYTAARLLVEMAGQPESGQALYRSLAEGYPDDPLADKARQQLGESGDRSTPGPSPDGAK